MKRMGKWSKRIVSAGLSLALLAGAPVASVAALSTTGLESVQAASAVTRTSIHDGTILHAFCWNFNTIKDKMPEIAAAGYTAVQTSPINECLDIHPGMKLFGDTEDEGRWYYHYQPTDWKIGNYQLGSRDEFKAMCDEAEKFGVGVIVDIAPNHTTPLYDQVSEDLKNAAGGEDALYHIGSKVVDGDDGGMQYDNRTSVTYDAMGGLPDVDTENPGFQKYFYDFLEDCIECGADGFRIDTAKHIALPDDGVAEEYAGQEGRNNFYPNMKDAIDQYGSKKYADLFVYGEVLDGDASRVAAYQDMLGGTVASNYGGAIRNAVSSGNVAVKKISNYKVKDDTFTGTTYKEDDNKLVTWVESHDNYINDKSYNEVDDRDVILGWAVIAARADGTPLFFSRPDGSSKENPWGNNVIGVAGSDIYKAPEVVAVNKFRTAMENEPEFLRNPGNNSSVLMIERGAKGVVIVNDSENPFSLDSETNLAEGTYVDSVADRTELYTVADGKIYGTVPAKSVVVLDTLADGEYSTLFFHNTDSWSGSISAVVGNNSYPASSVGEGWWKVTIPQKAFTVVFTDGTNKSAEFAYGPAKGRYMTARSNEMYATKEEAEKALGIVTKTVYFFNTEEWKNVYAYAWTDGVKYFGEWPGIVASNEGGYWWRADIKMVGDSDFSIIFNNGNGSQTENISMSDMTNNCIAIADEQPGGNLVVDKYASKAATEEALGINGDSTTVYFYNAAGWDNVGVYTWGDVDLGGWPGKQAEYEGDGWWKLTINAVPSSNFNIIFNNFVQGDEGKRQTEDMKADSLKKVYFIGAKYKYSSKAAALKALAEDNLKLEKNLKGDDDKTDVTDREVGVEEELAEGQVRIYYYNSKDWDEVAMYAWTDGANTEYFGGWPGKAMTHIGKGWYSVTVSEAALTHNGLHLIANNNGGGSQVDNVELITERPDVNVKPSEPEKPEKPEKPEEPKVKPIEEEEPEVDGMTKMYIKLDNEKYFDGANVYAWTDGENTEYFGGWPGKAMKHIGNGWYSVNASNEIFFKEEPESKDEEILEESKQEKKEKKDKEDKEDELSEEEKSETDKDAEPEEELVEDEIKPEAEAEKAEDNKSETEQSEADKATDVSTEEPVVEETKEEEIPVVESLEEMKDAIASMFNVLVSAFNPMEVKAAENQLFIDGIHLIVNNGNGYQEDDVNARFTLVRPSAEELKQEEVKPEPEKPAKPSRPAEYSGYVPAPSNTNQSQPAVQRTVVAEKTVTIAENQVPAAGPQVDNSALKAEDKLTQATNKTKVAKVDTKTEDTTEAAEEEETEDVEANTEEETSEKTEDVESVEEVTTIKDEETPVAIEESNGLGTAGVVAIVVVIGAALAAGGVIFFRKAK